MNIAEHRERRIEVPSNREFLVSVGRAIAGALIFALPMLMTMEMWSLGVTLHPWRILLLLMITLPLLFGLSHFSGIRRTACWQDEVADIFVVTLVSVVTSAFILWLFGVLEPGMSAREIISKLTMQFVPCSIGAMLARSQLGESHAGQPRRHGPSYGGELFLMMAGALFLSLNVAPTEEVELIAQQMSTKQEILLALCSLLVMQIFVYAARFRGGHAFDEISIASVFARYTLVGYVIVILVSLALMWLLGRTDGEAFREVLGTAIVVGFPGAIGAAAARLVL